MVVAVRVRARFVALLRNIDLAADDGMNSLLFGVVVKLDGPEEIAMIGHGDGRHLFSLDDLVINFLISQAPSRRE